MGERIPTLFCVFLFCFELLFQPLQGLAFCLVLVFFWAVGCLWIMIPHFLAFSFSSWGRGSVGRMAFTSTSRGDALLSGGDTASCGTRTGRLGRKQCSGALNLASGILTSGSRIEYAPCFFPGGKTQAGARAGQSRRKLCNHIVGRVIVCEGSSYRQL